MPNKNANKRNNAAYRALLPGPIYHDVRARSQEISITIPFSISRSLDYFLAHGYSDLASSRVSRWPGIDTGKATFIRILLSAYGFEKSNLAFLVNSKIWNEDKRNDYITVRTANWAVITSPANRVFRLVCAMVFRDIPIYKYDSKTGRQIGVYFDAQTKIDYVRIHGGY